MFQAGTSTLTALGTARDPIAAEMQEQLDRSVSTVRSNTDHDSAATLENQGLDLLQQAWLAAGE